MNSTAPAVADAAQSSGPHGEWVVFGVYLGIMLTGVVFADALIISSIIILCKKKSAYKKVQREYDAIHPSEKEKSFPKLSEMEDTIATVLSPKKYGISKYRDAWKAWSRDDRRGFKELNLNWLDSSPYNYVQDALWGAERAMNREKTALDALKKEAGKAKNWRIKDEERALKVREKMAGKTKEAILLAALMWTIYWPEQIEKAKAKKAKKAGITTRPVDSPV
jgi:hypothetical protein